ncbi:MAG: hypothetical protein HY788_06650 [Deltaproteobacteria bacterium]|nr:hypothetical protein [Deltaproteobacteria bacterium]
MGGIIEKVEQGVGACVLTEKGSRRHAQGAGPFLCMVVLFFCVLLSGLVAISAAPPKGKLKVATVKFDVQGKIDIPDAGAIVANWFTAALVQNDKFDVKERLSLDEILSEQAMSQTGIIDPKTAAKVGNIYGVEAIIMGSVVRLDERLPIYVSVRMIDTNTGTILKYLQGRAQSLGDLERTVFSLADDLSDKKPSAEVHRPASAAPVEQPMVETRLPEKASKTPPAVSETPVQSTAKVVETPKDSGDVGVMEIRSSPSNAEVHMIDRSKRWLASFGLSSDWKRLGTTPYINPQMPAGKYWIRVSSGSKEEILEVTVDAGKTVRKMVMFQMIGQGGMGDYGGM